MNPPPPKSGQELDFRAAHPKAKNRLGDRYGRLVVIGFAGTKRGTNGGALWLCRCDCGVEKVIAARNLRAGSKSCGCQEGGPRPTANRNIIMSQYKHNAKRSEWGLTDSEFDELTASNCYYCGIIPSTVCSVSKSGVFIYNGIDRKDNSIGYIPSNVVPCCTTCNLAKRVMSYEDFMDWIKRIIHFNMEWALNLPS